MAKVKIKGIAAVQKNIEETLGKVSGSKQMLNEIGEFVEGRVKAEIRRAKPLNDTRSFPKLKDSSIRIREQLAELNTVHPTFKPNRSNTTFTGQLVDAINYMILRGKVLSVFVKNIPRAPVVKRDGSVEQPKTNQQIQKDLKKIGFVLYTAKGLDSEPRISKRINGIVKKFVRRAIKVNFES